MKIYSKDKKIIIELDKWQSGSHTYGGGKWTVQNLIGIIAGDEAYISQAIYLDYKDDLQEGSPLICFYGEKEDFRKLCKELDIDIWEHEICKYCNAVIYGTSTYGDKGNMCMDCEYKEHEKVKENDLLKKEYEKGKQDENTAWLQRERCSTCGKKMKTQKIYK